MDMRKVFVIIDHPALIEILRLKGLPEAYNSLLFLLYSNLIASVNLSSKFPFQRGIKQDDTFNIILIKLRLGHCIKRRSLD